MHQKWDIGWLTSGLTTFNLNEYSMLKIDKSVKIVNVNTSNRCQEDCVQI